MFCRLTRFRKILFVKNTLKKSLSRQNHVSWVKPIRPYFPKSRSQVEYHPRRMPGTPFHSKNYIDTTVTSKWQCFMEGLSMGAKNPTLKGRRLIVVHMGNENGFEEGADDVFEKKNTGYYHQSMDTICFERWFENTANCTDTW